MSRPTGHRALVPSLPVAEHLEEAVMRKANIREQIADLRDELKHGIRYSKKRNEFVVTWTARQLRNARRRADRIWKKLNSEGKP